LFFPTDLTFSPDDRYLAGVDGYQLWICEVATGQVSRPMYTGNSVFKPDWSSDGKKVLYGRVFASPPDSGGIRILDLEAGSDTALKVDGQIIGTMEPPLWTRDGEWVACAERFGTNPRKFSLIKADGSERRVVISTQLGEWWNPRRYYRPAHGRDGFLFSQALASVPESGAYYVHAEGSGLVRTSARFIFMRAFSPDGSEYVWTSADPSDTNFVLAVFQTDDATGTSRRPITSFAPPPGQTPTEALAPLARAARAPEMARFWRVAPRE
jgi:Tol biopolymer transport system component